MDRIEIKPYDYGRQIERRRQARRRARRRVFFLAAAESAAGVCMTMAVMAMVIPKKRELGMAGTEQGRIKQEITERERIERQCTGRGGTRILSRTLEDACALQSSIKGQGESLLSFGSQNSLYTGPLVIAVDADRGDEDEGASQEGVMEKDINLAIAGRLKVKLEDMGYTVAMMREDDVYRSKEERVEAAYKVRAGAYVSIYQNTWEDAAARGTETRCSGEDGASDSGCLAALVHKETVRSTGAETRELRGDAESTVTGQTFVPSCLIETRFLSNPRERERLTDLQYQEKLAGGIAKGIDLYFNPKTIYFTFDGSPSVENTSTMLDVLKAKNIRATFFVVGENVRKHSDVARRVAAEGHTTSIHYNHHNYKELYENRDSYLVDFEEAYRAVLEVAGVKSVLYRFLGGSINGYNRKVYEEIITEIDARRFVCFDWNASLDDALKKSRPQEPIDNAMKTIVERQQVVLLAHDMVHSTFLYLDGLIDQLPEYRTESLTPEVAPVRFREQDSAGVY